MLVIGGYLVLRYGIGSGAAIRENISTRDDEIEIMKRRPFVFIRHTTAPLALPDGA